MLLFIIEIKNGCSVLGASVYKLTIRVGRIYLFPEGIEKLPVGYFGRVKDNLNSFSMAGHTGTYLFIGWAFFVSTYVPWLNLQDTWQRLKRRFQTPKTSSSKDCLLQLFHLKQCTKRFHFSLSAKKESFPSRLEHGPAVEVNASNTDSSSAGILYRQKPIYLFLAYR